MAKRPARPKLSDAFRQMALSMPGAVEGAHMGHADFRAGRIFATLNQDESLGVVMLTPEEQREFVQTRPSVFVPVNGGWGARGATHVKLDKADETDIHEAISTAWRRIAAKPKGRAPSK